MNKKLLFVMFVVSLGLAFPAVAEIGDGGKQPFQNDVVDPCPTYDSCTMLGGSGSDFGGSPTDSYSSCLPYMDCTAKRWDSAGKVTYSACEQSGEHACAYSQDNPNLCGTLTTRHADCSRLN